MPESRSAAAAILAAAAEGMIKFDNSRSTRGVSIGN